MASTARGRILQALGVILVLFGVYSIVRVSTDLAQVFLASTQELPDRGTLATYGITALVVDLLLIATGIALVAHHEQFRWRQVPEFFTKTPGRRALFRIGCVLVCGLLIAGLLLQDSWAPRVGYGVAIFFVLAGAVRLRLPRQEDRSAQLTPEESQSSASQTEDGTVGQEAPASLITEHRKQFHGLPVWEFDANNPEPPAHPVAWRVSVPSYDAEEQWPELFAKFLAAIDPATVTAFIVGSWADAYDQPSADIVQALVAAAPRLTGLRALHIGDMTFEDCEISWIRQSDLTPLLTTFDQLEELVVRGGTDLELETVRHTALQRLVIESGGLPVSVVRAVAASELPALTDLELWLGTEEYGADSTVQDVAPILTGVRLPKLTRLALCNSDYEDQIAIAAATAPVIAQLTELDLSMGVLMDSGAQALLTGQPLTHLTALNLKHNYLSEAVKDQLRAALETAGVQLNLERDGADEEEYEGKIYRHVAVGE